jgi:AraC-like DNA-binding protein
MNWQNLLSDLCKRVTLQEIADECGFSSRGHVHDLKNNNQRTVSYEVGTKLVEYHKRVMRRKEKA